MKTATGLKCLALSMVLGAACNPQASNQLASWAAQNILGNGNEINGTIFNGVNFNGVNFNGVNFNGVNFNGVNFNGVNFNGVNFNGIDVGSGLAISVPVSQMVGMTATGELSDDTQVQVRVNSSTHDTTWNVDWYDVSVSLDNGGSWGPLCAGGVGALPVGELWDVTGSKIQPTDWNGFTLACDNAAIAKCVKWGYDPAATRQECTDPENCTTRSLQPWHQACTRMVRADYCGDGVSHTKDGTPIDIYDNLGVQIRSGDLGTIEADWAPDGAHCIRKTRYIAADGTDSDLAYINTHTDGSGVQCAQRLASSDDSCGGDPNTSPDKTSYVNTLETPPDWNRRHLLRNDSATGK